MGPDFTVKDVAARIARCTELSEAFHARQLRHWAAQGVLAAAAPIRTQGTGPTAAIILSSEHLVAARIFVALAACGCDADQLKNIAYCMNEISLSDQEQYAERDADGLTEVLPAITYIARDFAAGKIGWFFTFYRDEKGEIWGGSFATAPAINSLLKAAGPIVTTLTLAAIMPPMFDEAE
jgi:hypothetical protein